ncbi:oxidoreductase family protein [Pontibacter ummariensis]|uniref:Oxidoreductase family, NAD-binding Rossmann fold n=1 Tax=Pontibacter ummariensis TaxID=1610492 RepID=A0A239C1L8_9BACT|nr:Gfo/Idh/MocA family oxidoreductase [Pontibacter ummariensis]PRY15499.1 oxidoreductase family protein [Pontibacter ummariensis]SNS14030.1 Oxidoreductase family, NAD-binding Rossmann fold [Pontibacter ummariensis]
MSEKDKSSSVPGKSRRDFLKAGALAAAGFMIVPRHVLGGPGFLAPSDRLVIAGIGVGGKGESDIASFFNSGKADIGYLCDVDDRRAANSRLKFPKAKYYKDYREMLDKEAKHIDAVSISTPDHNHAVQAMAAMQLGKHVYVQKPLTHDIYEARALTEAAKRYKVVTQMGNQGASGDGVRQLREWYDAGVIGDVHTVYCWTDRPVWPQGISWPAGKAEVPKELDWDLWLGTAPYKDYVEKLVPFNWRGWWDYGTGALGDMGCHLIEAPFSVLGLQHATDVQASVGSVYVDEFKRGYFPESCPPSSHVTLNFPKTPKTKGPVKLHWMDGGIQPERPEELGPNEVFGDGGNGILFVGTKGKMMASTYAENPRLLPTSRTAEVQVKQKLARVPNSSAGHYAQWVEGCLAGYGKKELSAPFEISGPLTEALLMANLAIRGNDVRKARAEGNGFDYLGRNIKLLWDNQNMRITNLDEVNQFVKREYRSGWSLGV